MEQKNSQRKNIDIMTYMNRVKGVSAVLLAALALVSCGKKDAEAAKSEDTLQEKVEVLKLAEREIAREINLSAILEGYETVNIAPSVTGIIEHIYVEEGDRVREGDSLVRMDQYQYKTTKLAFANLGVEMNRVKALKETGSISEQTYDQTKLSYDQTEENLAFLESNTYVKAPMSGVISAKNYEDGELYSGQPVLVLTQIARLKAKVAVPESYFPLVKEGMKMEVRSDIYPDKVFNATVEIVYPTIDATSHTFHIKLDIPNSELLLRPGMYVQTHLELNKVNAIVVPYQAVMKLQGSNDRYVFLNDNGTAKRVGVKMGQRFDDHVEIISDEIHAGDELVVTGQARLVDGVKLSIVK